MDGQRYGKGVFTYANGDKYEGEYKNGQCHGRGVYSHANGDKYEGEYKYMVGMVEVCLPMLME